MDGRSDGRLSYNRESEIKVDITSDSSSIAHIARTSRKFSFLVITDPALKYTVIIRFNGNPPMTDIKFSYLHFFGHFSLVAG